MKKKMIIATLLSILNLTTYAQKSEASADERRKKSKTETNFNMPPEFVNIRDYVYLKDKARMIVELNNPEQYEELKNLHLTLRKVLQELSFYKDSLENYSGSVRIDYAVDDAFPFSKLRFKKHEADGDLFMNRHGELSRLKVDQDTVRIYVRHYPVLERPNNTRKDWNRNVPYNANHARMYQITFCLNNYADLARIADNKELLTHITDTLYTTKQKSTKKNPFNFPSSSSYSPYGPDTVKTEQCNTCFEKGKFRQYGGLAMLDNPTGRDIVHRSDLLMITGNIGVGTIRTTFAPYVEMGLQWSKYSKRLTNGKNPLSTVLRGYVSGYFLFEKGADNEYKTKRNWFVNADIGEMEGMNFGVGYLFARSGDYFKGVTTKAFFNITLMKKGLTLSPELIITNDFREVFPGLTLKVF